MASWGSMGFSVKVLMDLGPLKNFPRHLQPAVKEVVVRTAIKIKNDARDSAPVDTGALAAGLYVAAKSGHGGDKAYSRSTGLNPKAFDKDEVSEILPVPQSDYFARIGSIMAYWDMVEYGTHFHAPQPFIEPAIRNNRQYFLEEMGKAVGRAALRGGFRSTPSDLS